LSARQVEDARQVAILEVAVELHVAQGFVANLVSATRTLVMDLPTVWAAHVRGEVDRPRPARSPRPPGSCMHRRTSPGWTRPCSPTPPATHWVS
jgi:hypothetical protein